MVVIGEKPRVLVVEDEILEDYLWNLRSGDAYELIGASTLDEALKKLEEDTFDVVVVDLMLPDSIEQGLRVISRVKTLDQAIAIIVVTGHPEPGMASRIIHRVGASDFLYKPLDFADCRRKIYRAIEDHRYRLMAIDAAEHGGFAPIHNPYVAGSPLGAGNVMFYGQDEIFDFICTNIGKSHNYNHLALIGPNRIGKTSILQQLSQRLPPSEFVPVNVNCQAFGIDLGMPAFFSQLMTQIKHCLRLQKLDTSTMPIVHTFEWHFLTFMESFLPNVYKILDGRSLILCLDEFEELANKVRRKRLDVSVFDFLYNLMTQEQIVFVLAGTRRLMTLGRLYHAAANIVESTISREVTTLSPDATRRLIEERVAYSGMHYQEAAIELIKEVTGGYPYLVQLLCGLLVNLRNERKKNEITVDDVQDAISAVIETSQPGFFWESLTSYQKIVLLAVTQLWRHQEVLTTSRVEGEVLYMGVNLLAWPPTVQVADILRELCFDGLLREVIDIRKGPTYTLAFELSGKWITRHRKNLEQVLREKYGNN
ncbi:MAG: response regulator [Anaerolineae bacterium]|nr:response regulator [Anaerolineae bacterium]